MILKGLHKLTSTNQFFFRTLCKELPDSLRIFNTFSTLKQRVTRLWPTDQHNSAYKALQLNNFNFQSRNEKKTNNRLLSSKYKTHNALTVPAKTFRMDARRFTTQINTKETFQEQFWIQIICARWLNSSALSLMVFVVEDRLYSYQRLRCWAFFATNLKS